MTRLRRRSVLRSGAATAAAALAGCLGFFGDGDDGFRWPVVSADSGRTAHAGTVPETAPTVRWQAPLDAALARAVYATGRRAVAVTPAGLRAVRLKDGARDWTHGFGVTGGAAAVALAGDTAIVRRWFTGSDRPPRRLGVSLVDGTVRFARPDDFAGAPLWVPTGAGLVGLDAPGRLRRFDPASGDWGRTVFDAGGEVWGTVADAARLYVPVNRGGTWAVDAVGLGEGASGWSRRLPWDAPVTMIATGNRLVFADVPNVDGRPGALGLDPATGEETWRFTWADAALVPWRAVATPETLVLLARPARNEGAYRLAAIDLDSGAVRWRTDTDLQLPYAIDGNRVVGTRVTDQLPAPGLVAHTLSDGSEAWRADPAGGVGVGIATPTGLLAVLATSDGPALAQLS